jgi:hypothetical protein
LGETVIAGFAGKNARQQSLAAKLALITFLP